MKDALEYMTKNKRKITRGELQVTLIVLGYIAVIGIMLFMVSPYYRP